jgi:hypothetical protein
MRALCALAAGVVAAPNGLLHYATPRRFGGAAWLASALSSWLAVDMTGYPALWNPSWFVLPLTMAFIATLAITGGSGAWSAFVAGVAFAVTTESHLLFGTFAGVAAVIVLLTAPQPIVPALVLLASFVLTQVVISPLSSTMNVLVLRHWMAAHSLPVALVLVLFAASVPLQRRTRRAIRNDRDTREAAAVLVWLLSGAVAIGMVLPWAVSRPPQIRYYGAAFPAIGYAAAWLLSRSPWLARAPVARVLAVVIFAAIFADRVRTADFARAGWFMDDAKEIATNAGLTNAPALDIMLAIRSLPDGALQEGAAAFVGTAEAPLFPPRIVRAVRSQEHLQPPNGWSRIRVARGEIFTSAIDLWTHPEEAEICPDPPNGDPCVTLTRDDFTAVARSAGGLLHRVLGLRITRSAARIGEWTRRGTRSLLWRIPLRAAGPDATREIVFHDAIDGRIVAVDGTRWKARADDHAVVERPATEVSASITLRTSVTGKFEAGVPPMPFELREGELGLLPKDAGKKR